MEDIELQDRLQRATRLTAVKAFAVIATSPLHIDLSYAYEVILVELSTLKGFASSSMVPNHWEDDDKLPCGYDFFGSA
ncbi:hypothetical protein AALP_AA6G339900 [Arabis alpina]|uniref:Uncharacterized protein n=1 Tax=Arabis alpina TaxID=50452 RepID=A0A087GTH2_ARAAL|nr:hypothetical protein AALP_AA6G339900 [Arabis alpina]